MTDKEILQKAIEKAEGNGWNREPILENWGKIKNIEDISVSGNTWITYEEGDGGQLNVYALIFSHDFAKAFWKGYEAHHYRKGNAKYIQQAWKYYIQQMVLEKEPLKYIERFL